MTCTSTAPAVDLAWADAIALMGRLRSGGPMRRLDGVEAPLAEDEQATLLAAAAYDQWTASVVPDPGGSAPVELVVTDRRILVDHPRGSRSLWHLDLEHLQLFHTSAGWELDLHPVGINPHVRLSGSAVPLVAVHLAHAAFPRTWDRLAGLLPLLDAA